MKSAKQLREERASLAKAIRQQADALHADNEARQAKGEPPRDWNAEEKEGWEKVNADYNALTRQIEIAERVEAVEGQQAAVAVDPPVGRGPLTRPPAGDGAEAAVTEEHRVLALQSWFRAQQGHGLTRRQNEACRLLGFNPRHRALRIGLYDTRDHRRLQDRYRAVHPSLASSRVQDFRATLSTQTGTAGGYTVIPETLIRQLEINMLAFGGLLQVADSLTTTSGERISWPTADDTGNKGRRIGESQAVNTATDPTFGKVFWDAYKYTTDAILVPQELLEDSVFDLPTILGEMLGERLGRILNEECTTGSGAAMPRGIVPAAGTVSAASATAIAGDDIFNLVHGVDPAYRSMAGNGFMMHDAILLIIRKLKGEDNQYIWQSGLTLGVPDRLLGYPLTINQDMDSVVQSGKKTILFGQLSKYKVRRVRGVRFYRLQERYRDNDQDGFLAFLRADGNLLNAGTAPVKVLTH